MVRLGSAVWGYRHFILTAIRAEFKGRFARSRLGALWIILHPLAQAAIFAVVLSEVLGAKFAGVTTKGAYAIYLMSGMAAWGLFTEILNRCLNVFIEYAGTLKKIAFPRICLPFIVWGSALVTHLLLLAAMTIVFAFLGNYPSPAWLILPVGILLISMFAFGLGVLLGVFNVFSRDVAQVMTVVTQIWFWLTPIVYTADILPARLHWLAVLNPMVPLAGIYQDAFLHHKVHDLTTLVPPLALGTVLFALSFVVFRRASPELVDAL